MGEDTRTLRGSYDESFISGHRVVKTRVMRGKDPWWVNDDAEIQKILKRAFPKLEQNHADRIRAGRWARLIQLYYRSRLTQGHVASEMGISLSAFKSLRRSIKRTAADLRADGSGKRHAPIR